MGRSRGGLSTKIHRLCDALGLPLRFILTAGQNSDFTQAINLLSQKKANYVIADKGYDSAAIAEHIEKNNEASVVIPSKTNRKTVRNYDKILYKKRNSVERLFCKLKQFRRFATRYCKAKQHFEAFVNLACAWLWLN